MNQEQVCFELLVLAKKYVVSTFYETRDDFTDPMSELYGEEAAKDLMQDTIGLIRRIDACLVNVITKPSPSPPEAGSVVD